MMVTNEIFSGVKVLELASVLAGPSVGQFFAELGAEVIKVENPKSGGDVTRSWKAKGENTGERSAYFASVNWGKKSLALDYSAAKGLEILYKLVEQSDIVIVSFKPGDSKKLKVDFNSLKEINPKLIYGSITGYGEDNPKVGYDAVIQAESGFMSINGEKGGDPLKLPVALMDILAGHQLKEALLLAYIQMLKTGKGSFVSVSLIDAAMASLANQATNWLVGGKEPQRAGSLHPNIAPYGEVFKTADQKQVILAIGTNRQFQLLCEALEMEMTANFSTNNLRVENRQLLQKQLKKAIGKLRSHDLMQVFEEHKIPGGIVNSIPEAIAKYKTLRIGQNDISGLRTFVANAANLTNSSHFLPPPYFGQHSKSILVENLGLKNSEIDELINLKLIS